MRLILLILSMWVFGGSGQMIVTGSKPYRPAPAAGVPDTVEVRIDFRASGTSAGVTGTWNTMAGSPHSALVTISNLNDKNGTATGWSINTGATGNWVQNGGTSNNAVSGMVGGSIFTGASAAVYQSCFYNYGSVQPARYDAARPQFIISGLNPAKTYSIQMAGSKGTLGFDGRNVAFTVSGLTTPALAEQDQGVSGTNITSITTSVTLTVQPTAGGVINVYVNTMASGGGGTSDMAVIMGIIIKQY